jgi:hypothetical protein
MTIDVLMLVNDDDLAKEAAENIEEFFGVKPKTLRGAESIAKGYNRLARESKADILCFIHQDARVHFTSFVLEVYFDSLENPGILGFCGTSDQVPGKQWHECSPRYGRQFRSSFLQTMTLFRGASQDTNRSKPWMDTACL